MKNIILSLTTIGSAFFCHGQVYKFKAIEQVITRLEGKEIKPIHHAQHAVIVVFDIDADTLSIGLMERFRLQNDPSGFKETDSSLTIRFKAIDRNNNECFIVTVMSKLNTKHAGFFIIGYPDKSYLYYVDN